MHTYICHKVLLQSTLKDFQGRKTWRMEKIFAPYWQELIEAVSSQGNHTHTHTAS